MKTPRWFKIFTTLMALSFLMAETVVYAQTNPAGGAGAPSANKSNDPNQNPDIPARSVHIELEKVENSLGYDVEVTAYKQRWAKPYSFHIDNEHLKIRLTPGPYKVHTRSYTKENLPGRWSRWQKFWIQFKAAEVAFPAPGQKIKPMGDKTEKITFEWKAVPEARGYTFKLKDKSGNVIKHTMTQNTWFVTEVAINNDYSWQIVPVVDKRLEAPDQKFPFNAFTVLPAGEGMRSMKFEVAGNPKAVKYQFEFVRLDDSGEPSPPSIFDAREPNFKVRLRPGRFEVRVRSIDKTNQPSDWSSPQKFFIDFFPPIVIGPLKGQHVDADDDDEAEVTLRWQPVVDVNHYRVYVFNKKGEMIRNVPVDNNYAKVKLRHNRDYRWKVVAYSSEEPDRRLASVDDKEINVFHLDKFEKVDLNNAEESSAWYGWFRSVSSQVGFTGRNYDNNTLINQSVLANAGELAGGLWIRKTNFGLLAAGQMSAYRTDTQMFNYGTYGLSAGYRHIYDEQSRLRVWLGYYYRELPELMAFTPYTTVYNITKVRDSGPQLQASYFHSINDRWGWHTYGQFYYGLQNRGTPNGLPSNPQLSYQLGLAATYRFNDRYTGMIGYAYKHEVASYNSLDRSGNPNSVDFTGHYLNLIFEFALSKPHPNKPETDEE